jgi:hypothetical protein
MMAGAEGGRLLGRSSPVAGVLGAGVGLPHRFLGRFDISLCLRRSL